MLTSAISTTPSLAGLGSTRAPSDAGVDAVVGAGVALLGLLVHFDDFDVFDLLGGLVV